MQTLGKIGIDLKYLRGQGCDGASSMSSRFQGFAAIVLWSFSHAIYVHRESHSLSLALCHFYTIPVMRNCLGTSEEF